MTHGLKDHVGVRRVTLVLLVLCMVTLAARRVGGPEGNELRAITTVRAIILGELNYAADNDGYYAPLACAVDPACNPGIQGQPFEPPALTATGELRGYRFELHAGPRVEPTSNGRRSRSPLAVVAVPVHENPPGRAFCGDAGSSDVYVTSGTLPRVHAGRCLDTGSSIPSPGSRRKRWFQ